MKTKWPGSTLLVGVDKMRRRFLGVAVASGGMAALGTACAAQPAQETRLGRTGHKLVFQFNKADEDYQRHVLFSASEVLSKYGAEVKLVIVCFGPGIHILAHFPQRPVSEETRQQVEALADRGVEFHACHNTMKSLGWTEDDLLPFARIVDVGAADLMELQEQGFAYVSW